MFCNKCGEKVNENDKFCSRCGVENLNLYKSDSTILEKDTKKEMQNNSYYFAITVLILIILASITITIVMVLMSAGYLGNNSENVTLAEQKNMINESQKNTTSSEVFNDKDGEIIADSLTKTINKIESNQIPKLEAPIQDNLKIESSNKADDNSLKYKEALLKQIDSVINSEKALITFTDFIYNFVNYDAVRMVRGYYDIIAQLRSSFPSALQLIDKHQEITNMIEANIKYRANSLYQANEVQKKDLEIIKEFRETINSSAISKDDYTQISNSLNEKVTILVKNRGIVYQIFETTVQDIKSQEEGIGESLSAMRASVGVSIPPITPYSVPAYTQPTFNITRCFAGDVSSIGGLVSINCYQSAF